LAREQDVPPYVIFHDATLRDMAMLKPRSLSEMAMVSGVGERKLEAYGAAFLEVILSHH
jgi:ATP-dependent DNA helicase RecQ